MKLSVIIPSVKDPYLEKTLEDIKQHFKSDYEILVIDGKDGLRPAVNEGVARSKGDYILKTDEHCMFDDGLDIKLLATIEDDWIVTPVRYKLDVEKWEICSDDPRAIVYERLVTDMPDKIGGVEWKSRKHGREHLTVDENMVFQGSCWLMSRKHWDSIGPLQTEGYGTFAQEPVELALKTWLSGGKVMVNKTTWYAHKHRKFRRIVAPQGVKEGNLYSKDFWMNNRWTERKYDFEWYLKRFGL